jgi:hypothetical protein
MKNLELGYEFGFRNHAELSQHMRSVHPNSNPVLPLPLKVGNDDHLAGLDGVHGSRRQAIVLNILQYCN